MNQFFLTNKVPLLVAALAAVLPAAGCGGGDGSDITLTKAQFIQRADAICRSTRAEFETDLAAYMRSNSDQGGFAQRATAEEVVETIYIPFLEEQIDQVSSLGAPRGDEEEVAAFLEAMREALAEPEKHPVKFVRALNIKYRPFAKATKLAKAYGFTACGKG